MAQRIVTTAFNRHPDYFRTLREIVEVSRGSDLGSSELRILSFGCSTGAELQSLRCYFPDALLFGCDIDAAVLHRTRKLHKNDPHVLIFESTAANLKSLGPFDIILCMSVLCRYPLSSSVDNISAAFPFSEFSDLVGLIDESLAHDGLIALYNSSYRFTDWSGTSRYHPIKTPLIPTNGFVDLFDQDSRKIAQSVRAKPWFGHRRIDETSTLQDQDLYAALWSKNASVEAHAPFTHPSLVNGRQISESATKRPDLPADIATHWLDRTRFEMPDGSHYDRYEWRRRGLSGDEFSLGARDIKIASNFNRVLERHREIVTSEHLPFRPIAYIARHGAILRDKFSARSLKRQTKISKHR